MSYERDELLTLPEHMISLPVFSGIRVIRSLILCLCFVDYCLSFYPFSFDHCVVCPSIYGFLLTLWYLQILLLILCEHLDALRVVMVSMCLFLCGFCIVLCFIFALFVFVLCFKCPMFPVSLDCPFFIAPFNFL